ncbi:MAG: helix-turn-helix domain-containing protein [Acidimicrobiales bacterium]
MTRTSSPTVWRRWLAHEMRRLRQEQGLSQAQVAETLGCRVPKISLIESNERSIQDADLEKLLALFEVPKEQHEQYGTAAKNARKKGWWEAYGPHTIPDWMELFVGLEQGASGLRTYQPAIFHGLFHTPEYAAAILRRGAIAAMNEEKVVRNVELRTRRQQALWRDVDALAVSAVVDEVVLRRTVGGPAIMRAQLEHVIDVVQKNDHVNLQVVPFEISVPPEAIYGPFTIVSFPSDHDPDVVYIEHRAGAVLLESVWEVDIHSLAYEQLQSLALSPDDSLAMLRRIAREYVAS